MVPPSAFSLDAEQPDYDLDSEDEVFVNKLKKKMDICPVQFEEMIDRLEKGSGQHKSKLAIFSTFDSDHPIAWPCFEHSTVLHGHPLAHI